MQTVGEVLKLVETLAPPEFAFGWDRIGLLVGDARAACAGVVVTLDATREAMDFATAHGANVIVAHHPLIWDPVRRVDGLVYELARRGMHFIAAHTNWDCAPGGVSDALAAKLGLREVVPFGSSNPAARLKLVTFVPNGHVDSVMDALAAAGAGAIGEYARCAFLGEGFGTYEASSEARPFAGLPGKRHIEPETRLEMILPESARFTVEQALLRVHPYETPAYDFLPRMEDAGHPVGRLGELPEAISLKALAAHCEAELRTWAWTFGSERPVHRIAVAGGAASGEWRAARAGGADVLVTGEAKHNEIVECEIPLILVGHHASEQPGMIALAERLGCPIFDPAPGTSGRTLLCRE